MPAADTLPAAEIKAPDKILPVAEINPAVLMLAPVTFPPADTTPAVFMLPPTTFPPADTWPALFILPPVTFDVTLSADTTLALKLNPAPFSVLALVMLPSALMVPPVMPGPTLMSAAMTLPEGENQNRGKLLIDATCAPADIKYPTDIGILNEAREKTEKIIDSLYKKTKKKGKKPRTYRIRARKDYLKLSKKRRPSRKERRKGIKKQIQYIQRNLAHIEKLREDKEVAKLSKKDEKILLIIKKAYEQQVEMYENKENKVENRIVSLTQPHVRPIVRGKAGTPVEFGAKLSASYVNGYVYLYRLSWDNYNESGDFKGQIEEFKRETGYYPKSVHADAIYRTRENRAFCKERGIRLSGPPLGRRPTNISPEKKKEALQDERDRNAIEGKFGQAKRRFSLNRVMTKLPDTSETAIAITFLVINLSALLRQVLRFFCLFRKKRLFFCSLISPAYALC